MEPLTIIAERIVEKVVAYLVSKWVLAKGEVFLGVEKNEFTKELSKIIYDTIIQFDTNNHIPDEGEKFPFYKSDILIQELLAIKFLEFGKPDVKTIQDKLSENPNILSPKDNDIVKFLTLFEENCKKHRTLKQLQFNSNYREAIFEVLGIVREVQGTLNKVILEIKSSLKTEYFAQLEEIQKNINDFRPKIALERIEGVEKRIIQNELCTPEIEAKLSYLKGVCQMEAFQNKEGAELIVQAYLKGKNKTLRIEAAFAYYNLGDSVTAKTLAEAVIEEEPFNHNAWLLLVLIGENNYEEVIKSVNPVAKSKRGFQIVAAHSLIVKYGLDDFKLRELGLTVPEEIDEKLNHSNISVWEKLLYIQLDRSFSPVREISFNEQGKIQGLNLEGSEKLLQSISTFFETIKDSDVYSNYPVLRFSLNFIRHLLKDANFSHQEFYEDYLKLKDHALGYELHYAEYLADTDKLEDALRVLENSKFKDDEQALFHRIIYTRALGKLEDAKKLILDHIDLIEEIDYPQIFNLNNLFKLFFPETALLKEQYQKIIKEKKFQSDAIKNLFKVAVEIFYFISETNQEELKVQLRELASQFVGNNNITQFIAQLLFQLQDFVFSANLLKPLTTEGEQTIANLLYCQSLYRSNQTSKDLLSLLSKIRTANDSNYYEFLALETNLRLVINDSVELIDISWRGVKQYPENEFFHQNLLASLERQGDVEGIKEYVHKHLKPEFRNEEIGIYVSEILARNGFPLKGARILYELAQNVNNHLARTQYATFLKFPEGFLIDYNVVQEGSHVKLMSKELGIKLTTVNADDKYKLIGKMRGDEVFIPAKSGGALNRFTIERIMNAPLYLFEQILQESANEASELGMEMFNFNDESGQLDIKAFERFLVEKVGVDSDIRRKHGEELIAKYKRGEFSFSELCIQLFNSEPIPCYEFLTSDFFMAIPAIHNSRIVLGADEIYVLDFTSLILFSHLEKKHGIQIDQKFIISSNLVALLKNQIVKLRSFPSPQMNIGVRDGKVSPIFYPENFNEIQIQKYEELLNFISKHCEEKIVEEKVEFTSFLETNRRNEIYFQYLVDNALFATTLGYTLISNDSFTIQHFPAIKPKQISPELFWMRHFQGKYQKELVEYFVEKKYVRVAINGEVLFNEYVKMRKGLPNSFDSCLLNLRFGVAIHPANISLAVKFLKEIYLKNIATEQENYMLAMTVFAQLIDGCSGNKRVLQFTSALIQTEFRLMGNALDSVLDAFNTTVNSRRS